MASETKKTIGQEIDDAVRQREAEAKKTNMITIASVLMDLVATLRKSEKRATIVNFRDERDDLMQPISGLSSPAFLELQAAAADEHLAIDVITKHSCAEYGDGKGECTYGCTYYAYKISVALPGKSIGS